MKFKRIILFLLISIFALSITSQVFAKYTLETQKLAVETNLDRTPPKVTVSYSEIQENGEITVTIVANEKIQPIDGWILSEDKLTLTKNYDKNINEQLPILDLAGNKTITDVIIESIDNEPPKVEIINISNSNTNYPYYANSSKTINLTIKISDDMGIKNINLEKVAIMVDNTTATLTKTWQKQSSTEKEVIYNLKLTKIKGNGILTVLFENAFAIDIADNESVETDTSTNITIDNIKPQLNYSQNSISQGKIEAVITANEKIKKPTGWNISYDQKQLSKDFVSNVSYNISISDLAGNTSSVTVNITGATYINLIYASHNSMVGWSYGHGNYDIAGLEAVEMDSIYKTEALAFHISGNISKDFVKARAYVYTYWGEGSSNKCYYTGAPYRYGYNPNSYSWATMNSSDLVNIDGKQYFQFGGSGLNFKDNTDINGNNPVPGDVANEYRYGISSIAIALKDYTDYSIVYQIYVDGVGWLAPKSNGQETSYSKTKPMSAFRVALIPTSELNNQLSTWDIDTGKTI